MKALGLCFAVFVLAAVVAAPAHAGPLISRPPIKFGPRAPGLDRDHHRHFRNGGVLLGWDEALSDAPEPASAPTQVVYATENVYVAAPPEREPETVKPPRPRVILLGVRGHARPSRPLPEIIYGDARP